MKIKSPQHSKGDLSKWLPVYLVARDMRADGISHKQVRRFIRKETRDK